MLHHPSVECCSDCSYCRTRANFEALVFPIEKVVRKALGDKHTRIFPHDNGKTPRPRHRSSRTTITASINVFVGKSRLLRIGT